MEKADLEKKLEALKGQKEQLIANTNATEGAIMVIKQLLEEHFKE